MKCALCNHRAAFPEVGRSQGDNRRVYRCPRCKYDQAKNLFGTGQFLAPGRLVDLRVPAETSLIKLA